MSEVDINKVLGFEPPSYEVNFNKKDSILYSLGIGF